MRTRFLLLTGEEVQFYLSSFTLVFKYVLEMNVSFFRVVSLTLSIICFFWNML